METKLQRQSYTKYIIVSAIPAPPGWVAAFKEADGSYHFIDIACFVLATDEERECRTDRVIETGELGIYPVVGIDWMMEIANKSENFIAAYGPNDPRPTD